MSNSRAKYEELKPTGDNLSQNKRSLNIILDILKAANDAGVMDILIDKAYRASDSISNISPVVAFQIAAEEAKIDELYS